MCGIVGALLHHAPKDSIAVTRDIAAMTRLLEHRGPDHQDHWNDGVAFLGAARLAVLDTSPAGNQPMGKDHVQIVVNGEIYNYRDLRRQLETANHRFRGESDTEVVLHGYLEWGSKVLDKLRGMYALAIRDSRENRLLLARDRVGKKPLYYFAGKNAFVFASEAGALLRWPGLERRPDFNALHHFLSFQYVPSPESAFTGVAKLPPGHLLEISPAGPVRIEQYTRFTLPDRAASLSLDQATEEFTTRFDEAVRRRMASDVPLGVLLSGGIDSSAVAAFMNRHTGTGALKTFCLGFSDPGRDEREHARSVAEFLGADHHEAVLEPDLKVLLPTIAWRYGEPFADPSALPSYCIAEQARQHVTVVLTGDGGDEAFMGYPRYQACRDMDWARRVPAPLRRLAGDLAKKLPADADGIRVLRVLRRALAAIDSQDTRRYARHMAYFEEHHQEQGYGELLQLQRGDVSFQRLAEFFAETGRMDTGAAWADLHSYLPDDLLVKLDIATMAHGLEARSPFLDQDLMDWALALPPAVRAVPGETKAVVKAAIAPMLPKEILHRPKQGFGVPLQQWLGNELLPQVQDLLLSQRARERGLFKPGFAEKLIDEHRRDRFHHHTRLWAMLMLELWFLTWIDPPDGREISPVTLA